MKILLVEDDVVGGTILSEALTRQSYTVDIATDGQTGLELATDFEYDLLLIDWFLPALDGLSLCRSLRSQGYQKPILLLTANNENSDIVAGLNAGADDYVIKPYNLAELMARIRALLRRENTTLNPLFIWGDLVLNPASCDVTYSGKPVILTAKEYAILEFFLHNQGRVFSRSAILDRLWSFDESPSERTVTTHIKDLRQKLKKAGMEIDPIDTVYGLGYRFKSAPLKTSDPSSPKNLDRLANILDKFRHTLQEQVNVLKDGQIALLGGSLDLDLQMKVRQEAHKLAGSLGVFGYPQCTEMARAIEKLFSQGSFFGEGKIAQFTNLLAQLEQELAQKPQTLFSPEHPVRQILRSPHILVVDDDLSLTNLLQVEAKVWGMEIEVATELIKARQIIQKSSPDLVLLDLTFPDSSETGFKLLEEISQDYPSLPVLIFTAQNSFEARLQATRLGGKGFLAKPIGTQDIFVTITQVLNKSKLSDGKVLIVEPSLEVLDQLRTILEPWGFQIILLDNPYAFWETLEKVTPDILIIALEMSDVGGLELCQVVRQDAHWSDLPIFILTEQYNAETVQQMFLAGADDYITKPVVAPELVGRVLGRWERVKLFHRLADIDGLTGVSNRRKALREISRLLGLAQREKQGFCFAILDLDRFKQVNDRQGHSTGDKVLASLGKILNSNFRSEDVVARWGGEEFAVVLWKTGKKEAVKRLNQLLDKFKIESFFGQESTPFYVTFSGGVAEYPEDGTDFQSLYHSADRALYRAKKRGRSCVLAATYNDYPRSP